MNNAENIRSPPVIGVTTSQSNINKSSSGLLNYIPIIILAIILLIGFVTWDLMTGNWQIFVSLILTFIYVAYIHYLSPKRFLDMKKDDNLTILPQAPYGRIGIFDGLGGSDIFMQYGVPLILFVAGLGMGIGSMLLSNIDTSVITRTMISIGSIMLIIGFLRGAWGIYKKINSDGDGGSVSFLSVIISIAVGIPLIVRGKQIQDKNDEISNDASISKDKQNEITEGTADVVLGTGLFFQIVGFMVAGHLIWINSKDVLTMKTKYLIGLVIFVVMFILSSSSVAASQKYKYIPGASELTPYEQKVYLVHGIIWLIAMVGLILTIFGQTKQYDFHNVFRIILIVIVIGVGYITFPTFIQTNFITPPSADDKDFEKSEYYQQLRTEVIKELQKTNPNARTDGDEFKEAISKRLSDEKKQSETPTTAMLWTSVGVSIIIVIFIFWSTKERLYLVGNGDDNLIKLKIHDFKEKIINDKMNSDDWDKELGQSEIPLTVRFAKWFSLIPFLSMILILLWVSVLFTNVTTSAKTSDWIAIKFSGDMYPRVKKLLDAFFIVLIIGFVLCAIMLLPFVKEMNIGGLESILKFAESVQVWQFNNNDGVTSKGNSKVKGVIGAIIAVIVVIGAGLSWWWKYLGDNSTDIFENKTKPVVPDKWEWAIAVVVLLAVWAIPTGYHLPAGTHADFQKENIVKRILRSILTTVYLVPWFIIVLFRLGIYSVASLTGLDDFVKKRNETIDLLKFWNWGTTTQGDKSNYVPDLRLFPIDESPPKPKNVSSVPSSDTNGSNTTIVSFNETKVNAVGTLIKTLLLTMAVVIVILIVVYYVYRIDAEFVNPGGDAASKASGGIMANLDSPTAHVIYFIIAIVGIAGIVAYLREKFKTSNNNKNPEDYLFDDMKTEDETKPLRQLAFGATHIIYVVLMVIVWIYDRDKDDKSRMSVTGMTVLGLAILFFHYGLEFIDTMKKQEKPNVEIPKEGIATEKSEAVKGKDEKPSVTDLFTNIRFIINTVFFIVLCALAYYKQHGAMVALILAMFIFHLTKSALGVKLLKLLWLGISYIPCLFLDLLQSSQGAVGDTTRPIWIILAIEILLIAILYGGPYLINYIGASASQIVAAPVPLKDKYDTNLTTQSEQIFIFHNTGIDRTPEDTAANCPVEEKKRYNYSISGWFLLNNVSTPVTQDLEIFDFGGVPKMTYNSFKAELKLKCNLIDISSNLPMEAGGTELYNSKAAYNAILHGKSKETQTKLRILQDKEDSELDVSIPLQKWNYFVVNYNGKTMDLFLNTKLIFKSDFIMPDIQLKPITVGDTTTSKGLNGSICNFAFHKTPLTKEQIRWTYTMFKSFDPPMIGMKTIKDEVKEAGTATAAVYSK
jgi:hypothetical protein